MSARQQSPHSVVYLLHFATRYRHAGHYIGWSERLPARLAHHRSGTGARLMAAVSAAGIDFEVARLWEGADRAFERPLHNRKNTPKLCPICAGSKASRLSKDRTSRRQRTSSCP